MDNVDRMERIFALFAQIKRVRAALEQYICHGDVAREDYNHEHMPECDAACAVLKEEQQ